MSRSSHTSDLRHGVAHVHLLAVTCVLGALASTMLPDYAGSSGDPRRAALANDLESLRTAIEMYRYEHGGAWPAEGTADARAFEAALLEPSRFEGRTRGPYVVDELPANPFNGLRTVRVVDESLLPAADDTTGWLYDSATGAIAANTSGHDDDGRAYADR